MNLKSRILTSILASSLIMTFAGCSDNKDNPDANANQSQIIEDTTTVYDDLAEIENWKIGMAKFDTDITINGMKANMTMNFKTTEDYSRMYLDISELKITMSDPTGEHTDMDLFNFSNIKAYINDNIIYINKDCLFDIIAMDDPENADIVKKAFNEKYSDIEYVAITMDESDTSIEDMFSLTTTTTAPEGVTPEEIQSWIENTVKVNIEPKFEDFKKASIVAGSTHKLLINNNSLNIFINTCKTIIEDGSLRATISSLYEMSDESRPLTDEEWETGATDINEFLDSFENALVNGTDINFEFTSKIENNTAYFNITSDMLIQPTTDANDHTYVEPSDIKAPESPADPIDISFDMNLELTNAFEDITLPNESDIITMEKIQNTDFGSLDNKSDINSYNDDSDIINTSVSDFNSWVSVLTYNPQTGEDEKIEVRAIDIDRGDAAKNIVDEYNKTAMDYAVIDYSNIDSSLELVVIEYEIRIPDNWIESSYGVSTPMLSFNAKSENFDNNFNGSFIISSSYNIELPGARDVYTDGHYRAGDVITKQAVVTTVPKNIANGNWYIEIYNYPNSWFIASK